MVEFAGGGENDLIDRLNIWIHLPADFLDQALHLLIRAFHDQFDAPIRQIANIPGDVVLHRQIFNRVTEPHPLYASVEQTLSTMRVMANGGVSHAGKYIVLHKGYQQKYICKFALHLELVANLVIGNLRHKSLEA
jgi:hypothetical protein